MSDSLATRYITKRITKMAVNNKTICTINKCVRNNWRRAIELLENECTPQVIMQTGVNYLYSYSLILQLPHLKILFRWCIFKTFVRLLSLKMLLHIGLISYASHPTSQFLNSKRDFSASNGGLSYW